jgi:hypothetical protein
MDGTAQEGLKMKKKTEERKNKRRTYPTRSAPAA